MQVGWTRGKSSCNVWGLYGDNGQENGKYYLGSGVVGLKGYGVVGL